jgi:hypothetical protein
VLEIRNTSRRSIFPTPSIYTLNLPAIDRAWHLNSNVFFRETEITLNYPLAIMDHVGQASTPSAKVPYGSRSTGDLAVWRGKLVLPCLYCALEVCAHDVRASANHRGRAIDRLGCRTNSRFARYQISGCEDYDIAIKAHMMCSSGKRTNPGGQWREWRAMACLGRMESPLRLSPADTFHQVR